MDTHNKSTSNGIWHLMSHGGDVTFKFHSSLSISTMQWKEHRTGIMLPTLVACGSLENTQLIKAYLFHLLSGRIRMIIPHW